MRIINNPKLEVTFDRSDITELYEFFNNHMMIPTKPTTEYQHYPVYDKLVNIFRLLIDEQVEGKV